MQRVLIFLLFLSLFWVVSASAQINSISVAGDTDLTRITIETDRTNEGDAFLSYRDGVPVIEFVPRNATLVERVSLGEPTGGVQSYTLNTDRISFELAAPMMILRELAPPPQRDEATRRYIIDLTTISQARFMRAAKRDEKELAQRLNARLPDSTIPAIAQPTGPAPSFKPWGLDTALESVTASGKVIVIDPGHGGRDPGTSSIVGGQEKDIVLAASLRIKAVLQANPRYEVYLTRETDIYVDHEDRVSKARNWGADLFISIHVDASGSPGTNGASVYSIDTRGERRKAGAARQNGWHLRTGEVDSSAVETILEDLIKRETKSNSGIFAEMVLPELAEVGPLLKNPFRRDNLAVLLAPDVPAVLIELGFITNRADARRLKSSTGQAEIAEAIGRAVDAYFDRQDLVMAEN